MILLVRASDWRDRERHGEGSQVHVSLPPRSNSALGRCTQVTGFVCMSVQMGGSLVQCVYACNAVQFSRSLPPMCRPSHSLHARENPPKPANFPRFASVCVARCCICTDRGVAAYASSGGLQGGNRHLGRLESASQWNAPFAPTRHRPSSSAGVGRRWRRATTQIVVGIMSPFCWSWGTIMRRAADRAREGTLRKRQ